MKGKINDETTIIVTQRTRCDIISFSIQNDSEEHSHVFYLYDNEIITFQDQINDFVKIMNERKQKS